MQKKLKMLDELQEIDLRIDGCKGEREKLDGEVSGLEERLLETRNAVSVKKEELAALDEEKAGIEDGIAAERENIARSEANQKEIKTQKEYQAVSKEIATAKKLIAELEEQLLQKSVQMDELRTEISGLEESLSSLEQSADAQKGEIRARIGRLEEDIARITASRDEIIKHLPSSMMRRYGMLREQRRGIAVVEARDGSCLGCNMQLPPQLYNTLFRLDDIITCPHCQRILVLRRED